MNFAGYKVHVTRKAAHLYALDGTDYGVKTNYCQELALYEEAILQVDNNHGYAKGILYFL